MRPGHGLHGGSGDEAWRHGRQASVELEEGTFDHAAGRARRRSSTPPDMAETLGRPERRSCMVPWGPGCVWKCPVEGCNMGLKDAGSSGQRQHHVRMQHRATARPEAGKALFCLASGGNAAKASVACSNRGAAARVLGLGIARGGGHDPVWLSYPIPPPVGERKKASPHLLQGLLQLGPDGRRPGHPRLRAWQREPDCAEDAATDQGQTRGARRCGARCRGDQGDRPCARGGFRGGDRGGRRARHRGGGVAGRNLGGEVPLWALRLAGGRGARHPP